MGSKVVISTFVWAALAGWPGFAPGASDDQVTEAQFETWMKELSNWGRWGDDDELGALNLITPAKRAEAAALVEHGMVVSMARPLPMDASAGAQAQTDRAPRLVGSARSVFATDTAKGYIWERYEIEYHGGIVTHVDALCHVAYRGRVYNGRPFDGIATVRDGCSKLGIGSLRNGVVTRGVLVDLPGKSVRPADVAEWEARTGITIAPGDAVFLRTGRDVEQQGGYHPSLLPFFKERDIALLGADVPQEGEQIPGVTVPVHFFMLVALGVHLFDNLALEELARTAAELRRWEFMFTAAPHVLPNGAGAAVNPLAIF